ncbi:hypothetical protein FRC04_009861 [Tulasnella sp. 424]|nr:hypothetical protein FRC04_009861 [Tulasnella sp. 424]
MSDSTPGRSTESQKRKSPPVIDKEEETPGTPEKRSVVKKLSKWRVDAKDLVFAEENARERGGSADVARAKASIFALDDPDHEDVDVAVKKFRLSGDVNRRTQTASFANELSLLSELDHENIVKLTGFVESAGEDIAWILLRWENNGNIREFIHSQDWVIPERIALVRCGHCIFRSGAYE